jgi:hypothetical protein
MVSRVFVLGGQSGSVTVLQQQVIQGTVCPRRAEKPIMELDRRPVVLISSDGGFVEVEFLLWEESPGDADRVRLAVTFGDEKIARDADDFFSALYSIRAELEAAGLMPRCYGSSRNVYPSGMSRGMRTGDKAYRLYLGRRGRPEDVVDIFEDGSDVDPVSVQVQEAYYPEWLGSLTSDSD